ncbi:MAG TPA: hypothetical protein VGR63_12565 [Casimicrobiaceae bacterium]|nr:hypothetical protein [Casimicrobiaceae bacterium]
MMRAPRSTWAVLAALAAPVAFAQSISITGTPTTPMQCDSGHIMQSLAGGMLVFDDLPPGSNNVIILTSLNGGPPVTTFATEPAGSSSVVTTIYLYTPSTTSPPYTMDRWTFPASGGVAIGTGVRESGTCSAEFEAAATYTNGVLPEGGGGGGGGGGPVVAAAPVPAPTLAPAAIAGLALVVAALAGFALRRPRSTPGA